MRTEQLVSQIVLAASWDFTQGHADPVEAARELLGVSPKDHRLGSVSAAVARAASLSWEEQVGLAAHLLLSPEPAHAQLAA